MKKNSNIILIIISLACFFVVAIVSFLENQIGISQITAYLIIILALVLYLFFSKGDTLNPLALYSLVWIGCIGLSSLKLSYDQYDWSFYMWLNVTLAYIMFIIGYMSIVSGFKKYKVVSVNKHINNKKLFICIQVVSIVSIMSFAAEVAILKFIPLFSDMPNAYVEFHVTILHFFTLLVAIVPPLSIIYKKNGGKIRSIFFANTCVILISVLLVSRENMMFIMFISGVTYHYCYKKISKKVLFTSMIVGILLFSLASSLRNQNTYDIQQTANFKNQQKTILAQPYVYFTMSFENLRNLVENCNSYNYGLKTLQPILVFTGMRQYVNTEMLYLTNYKFNVSTFLYTIYSDFSIFGVIVISFLLGLLYSFYYIKRVYGVLKPDMSFIIYALLSYDLFYSFFTNLYSDPSKFFDLMVIIIISMIVKKKVLSNNLMINNKLFELRNKN